ncbi:nucleotidyltransferase domain-containing protein [Paenibacillus alkalitolerans]|uniref:nucleotidyltransferase domain-containing protein n=1 Tax=Paenibacillus alkalitolerans TaxID=2799335 RepID=UPI0018F5087B|nr:nucleotidyltransferase domain-containing protein [Paenibacillus alkalitolerans]
MRRTAIEAAEQFVLNHFSDCTVAILSGSVVQGMGTKQSDLDIVIIDDTKTFPFRESFYESGWPIEAFVLTRDTYRDLFEFNVVQGLPSLQRMCAQGIIIKDDGTASELIDIAREILAKGPMPWTVEEMNRVRYEISECLEDLTGSDCHYESIFIVNKLAGLVHEYVLRMNGCWIGDGKWIVRSLQIYNKQFSDQFLDVLDKFYKTERKEAIIQFIDDILAPNGGRLFEGYSEGKYI